MSSSCVFSNAILSARAGCPYSKKELVAEKEFATCSLDDAKVECQKVYDFLRTNSAFAIDGVGVNALTVAQHNKIRIGGLFALHELMHHEVSTKVMNITQLLSEVRAHYGEAENIPLETIIPKIHNFKIRSIKK